MASLPRDNTMVVTAKEGVAFLQKEGADDLIKLQGLDGAKNGNGNVEPEAAPSSQTAETTEKAAMETDAPPTLSQHRTIVETTKEAEQVLAGETLGETRASTEQLKTAVASSSPPQKSRTMVETAKIGQSLLGEDAVLLGETRKQTAETKKLVEEEKEAPPAPAPAVAEEKLDEKAVEKEPEEVVEPEKKTAGGKKSPPKKSPAKEKPSPAAKKKAEPKASPAKKEAEKEEKEKEKEKASPVKEKAEEKKEEKKEPETEKVPEANSKTSPAKKDAEEKPAKAPSPRKRGGRPSLVDQLVQEAQKFAGNAAGDVSEGRVTRRSSKGAEPAAASPAKRPRQAKEKSKAAVEVDDNDEADD